MTALSEHLTRRQLLHSLAVEAAAIVNTADYPQQEDFERLFLQRYAEERLLGAENLETTRAILDMLAPTGGSPAV